MDWTELLTHWWPSIVALAALFGLSLPKTWKAKIGTAISGIDLPGIGPKSPVDAANDCVASFKAERDSIAQAEAELAERKAKLANAEAVAARGSVQ